MAASQEHCNRGDNEQRDASALELEDPTGAVGAAKRGHAGFKQVKRAEEWG